jgi:hypothetical protein
MLYLPQTFRLFTQQWLIRAARPGELPEDLGQCRPDQLELVINHAQADETMCHTLLHEVVHSWEQKLLLNLTEQQVDLLSLALLDFIRNNPDFFTQFQTIEEDNDDTAE